MEPRLMKAALGVSDLANILYENDVRDHLELTVELELSAAMAETRADAFMLENEAVEFARYDDMISMATLDLRFTWQGTQHPDRMWSGTAFYLQAHLYLLRRDGRWSIAEDGGLVVLNGKSDQDLDHEAQWNDLEDDTSVK